MKHNVGGPKKPISFGPNGFKGVWSGFKSIFFPFFFLKFTMLQLSILNRQPKFEVSRRVVSKIHSSQFPNM